jgi:hypothetical protein
MFLRHSRYLRPFAFFALSLSCFRRGRPARTSLSAGGAYVSADGVKPGHDVGTRVGFSGGWHEIPALVLIADPRSRSSLQICAMRFDVVNALRVSHAALINTAAPILPRACATQL